MSKRRPKIITEAPCLVREGVRSFRDWDDGYGTFVEVGEFTGTLKFKGISRGRSSLKFVFVDIEGKNQYSMFQSGFEDMLKVVTMVNGEVTGTFRHIAWSGNYGIELVF
jgi:hypothetical protein